MKIQTILDKLEALDLVGANDYKLILDAHELAQAAHADQRRVSGKPYIQHSLEVANLLVDFHLDPQTIAAGLLHDVVEDSFVSIEDLERDFGRETAQLVDGVTKLSEIDLSKTQQLGPDDQHMENLRKMFLAMSQDIRVVLIKLADRLHNMRTLEALDEERRRRIARETLDVFAPLAGRLGVWQWKGELEDLCFQHLQPDSYAKIVRLLDEQREVWGRDIQHYIDILQARFAEEGISIAEIYGRLKHIYSMYRKIEKLGTSLDYIHDTKEIRSLIHDSAGIRVITHTTPDCYHVLGIVHELWRPIPGKFHDYIATPKDNNYQSLHTVVVGEDGKLLEVQIRTEEMHRVAEFGVAAHWRYKEGTQPDPSFDAKVAWVRSVMEWLREITDASEFVDAMKTDIFQDRVYTFTPQGDIIDLPTGSTPIDFAYHIHTEVGHSCRGAKVNDKWIGLDYELRTGDRVEIITAKKASPSRDWLNPALGYIKTSRARSKIRQWFRRQDREKNLTQGREVVERELQHLGLEDFSHERVARLFGYKDLDDFHAAVGFGDINTQQIASKIAGSRSRVEKELFDIRHPSLPESIGDIQVQGTGGLMTRIAQCCSPLPGQEIIGYVTRGRGVSIHRRDCPNVLRLEGTERLIEVSWGTPPQTVPVVIHIRAYDRTGLLHEIAGVISGENINMTSVTVSQERNIAIFYITVEISNIGQLSRILTKIERLPNVIEARRRAA